MRASTYASGGTIWEMISAARLRSSSATNSWTPRPNPSAGSTAPQSSDSTRASIPLPERIARTASASLREFSVRKTTKLEMLSSLSRNRAQDLPVRPTLRVDRAVRRRSWPNTLASVPSRRHEVVLRLDSSVAANANRILCWLGPFIVDPFNGARCIHR